MAAVFIAFTWTKHAYNRPSTDVVCDGFRDAQMVVEKGVMHSSYSLGYICPQRETPKSLRTGITWLSKVALGGQAG